MIDRVSIRAFQSLVDTEAELGVLTVLIGPNDLGKSAFIRAIKSASSAASGTDFITYGHSVARVAISVDGHDLVWEKGTNVNRYTLDGVVAEKVGRSVPPEVEDLLSLGSVEFDKSLSLNLNFAEQDDPPFLIPFPGGLTTSHVAKVLGDLTNLNILYRSIGEADVRRRRSESTLKLRESDILGVEAQLLPFQDLPQRQKRVLVLDSLHADSTAAYDRWLHLSYLKNELDSFRRRHQDLKAEQAGLDDKDLTPLVTALDASIARRADLEQVQQALEAQRESFSRIHEELTLATAAVTEAEARWDELTSDLELCPLCNQPVDADALTHTHA